MGSCASKPKYVDYDPPMQQQQKKENDEHEVKQEDNGDVSPIRRSGSRPSLGILFQKEKDEQGELLTQQDEELKIPNPSANVQVSDKLQNSGACAIQSVVIEDQVKPTASVAYVKEVTKEPSNHETLTASLDSSSTNKAQDVGTDLGLPTAIQAPQSVEVSDVDHVENRTGFEGSMTAHESENQLMTVDSATQRGDSSSSLRDDNLSEDAKNSPKPGIELPVVDMEHTSDNIEDNNLGTKRSTGHVDNVEKSQDSEVKMNVVNDYQKSDIEDEVPGATLPVTKSYVLNTATENTCLSGSEAAPDVGDYIPNAVEGTTFGVVAIDRNYVAEDDSGNSLKSETMISNDVNQTSGELEDKEFRDMKLSIENHDAENFLKSESKLPALDNLSSFNDAADNKVGATQQSALDNNCGNDAENSLKVGKEVPNIDLKHCSNNAQDADLDVTMPINGSGQETCNRAENTDPVPVEDHHSNSDTPETTEDDHSNSLTLNRKEQVSDRIKASGNELDAIKPIDGFKEELSRKTENTDLLPVSTADIEDDHSNSLTLNREEQVSDSIKASGNELDAIKPIDGFKEELSRKSENTDLVHVEYHHGDFVSTAEEQFLESKKASVANYVDSIVPTSSHVSSVVKESVLSAKDPGERLATEPVETEGLHWRVEELAKSSQSDHLVTKPEAETASEDKNANQDNECSAKTIHSSQVHQEELTQNKHLPVLESASEGNCQTSSTNFAKELTENDKVPNVETVEGTPDNTHHVKDEL